MFHMIFFCLLQLSYAVCYLPCNKLIYYHAVTNKTQETKKPWVLSGDSSQGEAIKFAQFEGRKFYRKIPDEFSIFEDLATKKKSFVQPCSL